jgi:hypothetical protein
MPDAPFKLSEPVTRTVPAFTALTAAGRLTIPGIPVFAERATTDLMRLADAHRLPIIAPPVFIYANADDGNASTFVMQIAMPVAEGTTLAGPGADERFAVKRFDAFDCLAVDYRGPMAHIGDAYPLVVDAIGPTGRTAAEQSREVYKHWVGYDEPDNVIEIQIGLLSFPGEP